MTKYIAKRMLQSLITVFIITTTMFLEWIFAIPGLTDLLFATIRAKDNPLIQGIVTVFTVLSVLGILISDVLVTIIDPRIEIQ